MTGMEQLQKNSDDQQPLMSSLRIADLVKRRHWYVRRTIGNCCINCSRLIVWVDGCLDHAASKSL